MGSGAKAQVAGYFYYLGMHLIACHGPADFVSHILADDKIAWSGYSTGGPLIFFNTNLFGGPDKEGGLAGRWDIEMGKPDQPVNPYLALKLAGNLVPAFRGVVGFVAWQNYVGTTTYLKKLAFRISRIHVRQSQGIPQWYDAKAQIGAIWSKPQAFCFALDCSASMDEITDNGETRLTNAKTALAMVMDYMIAQKTQAGDVITIDLRINGWGSFSNAATWYDASIANLNSAKAFVLGLSTAGQNGTDFRVAASNASAFFNGGISAGAERLFFFMTDGEPVVAGVDPPTAIEIAQQAAMTIALIPGIKSYCFNIDLDNTDYTAMLDTTPGDAVPVITGSNPIPLLDAILSNIQGQLDMNPAHIIRECLTDPDWGMGYPESDIDDAAFTAAADKLYSESMGMSLLWTKQITIEEFIKQVMKHIDATLYVDMNSGKFVLKLIRDDYVLSSLLILDENNIDHIADVKTPTFGELTNSVTVQFWDSEKYRDSSLTVQDSALADMQQAVINTTVDYSGFTNASIASRVAQRDLKTLSTPLLSCTIYANRDAAELNIGHVFKLSWADYGIVELPMRVVGIAYGDGKRNQVRLTATQDVFSLPELAVVTPEPPYVPPNIDPVPVVYRLPYEVPYLEAVQQQGQAAVDALLVGDDGASFVGIAGERPNSAAISADMQVDSGSGYAHGADINFCPTAVLDEDIDQMATTFNVRDIVELDNGQGGNNIPDGTWFQMGTELMVKVSLVGNELIVKRGVLDTVPVPHTNGEKMFFWDTLASNSPTQYTEGNSVNVKMLPRTFNGVLDINVAPTDAMFFQGRLFRPYVPGNFKVNGEYFPVVTALSTSLNLSWSSRNRRQQTGADIVAFPDTDITPEPGTTYRVDIHNAVTGALALSRTASASPLVISYANLAPLPQSLLLKLYAVRDGVDSYQAQLWAFQRTDGPVQIFTNFSEYVVGTTLPDGFSLPWQSSGDPPHIVTIAGDSPAGRQYMKIDNTGTTAGRRAVIWDDVWALDDIDFTIALRNGTANVNNIDTDVAGAVVSVSGALGSENGVRAVIAAKSTLLVSALQVSEYKAGVTAGKRLTVKELSGNTSGQFAVRIRLSGGEMLCKGWRTADLDNPLLDEPIFWQGSMQQTTPVAQAIGSVVFAALQDSYIKSMHAKEVEGLSALEHVGGYWPEDHTDGSLTTATLSIPTNVKVDDLLIATINRYGAFTATPAGWTMIAEAEGGYSTTRVWTSVWYKRAAAAEIGGTNTTPKTIDWTFASATLNKAYGILNVIRSAYDWEIQGFATAVQTQVGSNVPLPSLVSTRDGSIALVACGWVFTTGSTGNAEISSTDNKIQQFGPSAARSTSSPVRMLAGLRRVDSGENVNANGRLDIAETANVQDFAQIAVIININITMNFNFAAATYTPPAGDAVNFTF